MTNFRALTVAEQSFFFASPEKVVVAEYQEELHWGLSNVVEYECPGLGRVREDNFERHSEYLLITS
jgi:hypothetical protein